MEINGTVKAVELVSDWDDDSGKSTGKKVVSVSFALENNSYLNVRFEPETFRASDYQFGSAVTVTIKHL